MPAPTEVRWNVMVAECSYAIRRVQQMQRDSGKRKGSPPPGWEADELRRVLRMVAEHTGLEYRG